MKTVEENFEADKIKAAIDYLEFKGELNEIKAQAIEEMLGNLIQRKFLGIPSPVVYYQRTCILNYIDKLRGE